MADTSTPRPHGGDIHRLLDEAFTGVDMTPETQDLKEEVRANLVARVADLEAAGASPTDAAQSAIDELGDIRELVGDSPPESAAGRSAASQSAAYQRARVRPRPAYVVRTVLASIIASVAITLAVLALTGLLPIPVGPCIALIGIAATALAWIVGDSLVQETTTNHPMPRERAGGYFWASLLTLLGAGCTALVAVGALPVWSLAIVAIGLAGGIVLFAFLAATQTNRHKAWLRAAQREHADIGDRFEKDPAAAARFGIYTGVIWIVAIAAVVVVGLMVGWIWSWIPVLGGFVVMMLVLARMLFGAPAEQR